VVGGSISKDTVISTSFKSTAIISLGKSTLLIRPLTRLTLDELVQRGDNEQVRVTLQSGRVRADVTPPPGGRTDFTVKSPIATASVRGTGFDFDTVDLKVESGRVQYTGNGGQTVLVDRGERSYISETENRPISPFETATASLAPSIPELTDTGVASTTTSPAIVNLEINITIGW
jgi:hypothetical protein